MEERKNFIGENEETAEFENVSLENLEELDEVVTPGWGTVGCCTN